MANETIESVAQSAMRLFLKCERCKGSLSNVGSPRTLLGDYEVWLCLSCGNAWIMHVRDSRVYREYCDALAIRDMLLAKGHRVDVSAEVWLEANHLVLDIRAALVELAREWVEAGVPDG